MKKESDKVKISPKHKAFIDYYLANGFNQSEAYREEVATKNVNPKLVPNMASKTMRRPDVIEYLTARRKERKNEIEVDQSYVINKYLEILESDFIGGTQYLSMDEIDKMPKAQRKLVQSIDVDKTNHKWQERYNGEDHEEISEKYKVTFMSKDKALDSLGKHTGAFMKDNISLQGNIESKSFTDALKDIDLD